MEWCAFVGNTVTCKTAVFHPSIAHTSGQVIEKTRHARPAGWHDDQRFIGHNRYSCSGQRTASYRIPSWNQYNQYFCRLMCKYYTVRGNRKFQLSYRSVDLKLIVFLHFKSLVNSNSKSKDLWLLHINATYKWCKLLL